MWLGGAITILKNMSSSMGSIIPYIMEHKKCLRPPTSMWVGKTRTLNLADGGIICVERSWLHRASVLSSAGSLKGVDGNLDEHRRGSASYPRYAASPSPRIPKHQQLSSQDIQQSHSAFKSLGLRWLWFSFKSQRRDPVGPSRSEWVQCCRTFVTMFTSRDYSDYSD